jgi:general stress protein YciG
MTEKEIRTEFARSGGNARAAKLTPEKLSEIGTKAARARWKKHRAKLRFGKVPGNAHQRRKAKRSVEGL